LTGVIQMDDAVQVAGMFRAPLLRRGSVQNSDGFQSETRSFASSEVSPTRSNLLLSTGDFQTDLRPMSIRSTRSKLRDDSCVAISSRM
jgi:hypothetical protein